MPSDDYYRRRSIWDMRLADLERWDALGVLTDKGRKLLAGLRQQAAYFEGREMDDAVRRIQEFEANFPRGPELRVLTSASLTSDGGTLDFVALRDSGEEITVPTEALRDLLTALQELPDAARLLVGSEITLSFRPGT